MAACQYRFGTHLDVPNLIPQLVALSNAAFASYEGAMPVDAEFMEWYLRRPGCRPELCTAALYNDELVSNVLVAIQELQLGGELLRCGIVDTVATAPAHQRRGLARRLMQDAHALMRGAGAEAAVLYTNPDGYPYRFYQSLGYQTRALAEALLGTRPRPSPGARIEPADLDHPEQLWRLADRYYAGAEGRGPTTADHWHWYRICRPASMPAVVLCARAPDGELLATMAFADAAVRVAGEMVTVSVLGDYASAAGDLELLPALLAAAPHERVMAFADRTSALHEKLVGLGFVSAVREAAMVLPFTARAEMALQRPPTVWVCMIESLVGV